MNRIIFTLCFLFFVSFLNAQVVREAVFNDNYRRFDEGDTVQVLASYFKYGYWLYVVTNGERTGEAPSTKISFIGDSLTFWEDLWFKSKSYNAFEKDEKVPNAYQKQKSLDLVLALQEENKIYDDPFVEDYLLQKIIRIKPPYVFYGKDSSHFSIKLLNQPSSEIFVLPNKTVLLSVDWLAGTTSLTQLCSVLNKAILYTFFGYHLDNYENAPLYDENPNKLQSFDAEAKERVGLYAQRLALAHEKECSADDDRTYINAISGIITYVAWQEYYNQNYQKSLQLLDKIIENGFASDEEYFLKARIYRKMYNNPQKNRETLELIEKAMVINTFRFPELMEEKGLMLLRLHQFDEAQQVFEAYLEALTASAADPQKIKWCRGMINKCSTSSQLLTN